MESMTLKHPDIVGGNGYAAATLGDMGFEPTLGAEGSAKPKKPRKKKGEGIAGAGGMGPVWRQLRWRPLGWRAQG